MNNAAVNKIIKSNTAPFGKKRVLNTLSDKKDDEKVTSLFKMLSKMCAYAKRFEDGTR